MAKGKRTFQPNNRRRARVHGFRLRMRTRAGRAIVSGRRRKGRRALDCLIRRQDLAVLPAQYRMTRSTEFGAR